jgi:hypothetical protein
VLLVFLGVHHTYIHTLHFLLKKTKIQKICIIYVKSPEEGAEFGVMMELLRYKSRVFCSIDWVTSSSSHSTVLLAGYPRACIITVAHDGSVVFTQFLGCTDDHSYCTNKRG